MAEKEKELLDALKACKIESKEEFGKFMVKHKVEDKKPKVSTSAQIPKQSTFFGEQDVSIKNMGGKTSRQQDAVSPIWDKPPYLLVASIDFGTTYTGWAFSFKDDFEKCPTMVQTQIWTNGNRLSEKAPTSILIQPDDNPIDSSGTDADTKHLELAPILKEWGGKKPSVAFGTNAERKYLDLAKDKKHKECYYFQHFKMALHKKEVNREMLLTDANGRTLRAITVFGLCIDFLKNNLLEKCQNQRTGLTEKDIYWVLTVPAIWNDAAKQFMREAAIFGGIDGGALCIGLEPECASIACRHLLVKNDETRPRCKYLVVDAGGGTIDIIAHELGNNGRLREIIRPTGSDWGGNRVNEAFMKFMDTKFGKQQMSKLKENDPEDHMDLLQNFELKKRSYEHEYDTVRIGLPVRLQRANCIADELVYKDKDKLRIRRQVFETFFSGCKQGMIDDVSELLKREKNNDIDMFVLVGGFSESKLIQTAMKSAFPEKTMLIPDGAGLAVLKGAVMYGHMTYVIEQRVCRYTYGIKMSHKYDDYCSHPVGRLERDENGDMRCYDLFQIHVQVGEKVLAGQEQNERICRPISDTQSSIRVNIYATLEKKPQLVTEKGCDLIGTFTVAVTEQGQDKEFGVSMMFGGTEIEVKCVEKQTRNVTKATVNFLG